MNIAILTSGGLPVPAVQGGAVECLIDCYLEYNIIHNLHNITVYSIKDKKLSSHPTYSTRNTYYYIDTCSIFARIRKRIYHILFHNKEQYHYSIEFFLHETIKHIQRMNYDVIIIENRPYYALKLQNKTSAKIIYHLHNDFLNCKTQEHTLIYNLASGIITVSNFITNRVKEINVNDTKCRTVYNGINFHAFNSAKEKVNRKTLGLQLSDFVVIFSGRLIPEKGIEPLIEAMNNLKKHSDIKLVVIGGVEYGNDNPQSAFLQRIMIRAKEIGNIIFTGYVIYEKVPEYLHLSDIAVLPSLWEEPFGLTCLESMAAGLPLITTRKGGIPEIVNKDCALLVDVNENLPKTLSESILFLHNHPQKRLDMSKAAISQAMLFDNERYAKEFFNVVEDIAK